MALDRDIQKSINQAAHALAQHQYAKYRNELTNKIKIMAAKRKTRAEIEAWLSRVTILGEIKEIP